MPSRIIQGQCYPMMTIIDSEAFHGLRVTVAVFILLAGIKTWKDDTRVGNALSWPTAMTMTR